MTEINVYIDTKKFVWKYLTSKRFRTSLYKVIRYAALNYLDKRGDGASDVKTFMKEDFDSIGKCSLTYSIHMEILIGDKNEDKHSTESVVQKG